MSAGLIAGSKAESALSVAFAPASEMMPSIEIAPYTLSNDKI